MKPKSIHFLATGGTIDAEPYAIDAEGNFIVPVKSIPLAESKLPGIIPVALKELGLSIDWTFTQLDMRDSKDYREEDIGHIAELIRSRSDDMFVISHGTDRMMQNARYMRQFMHAMGMDDKTITFMGAMIPLSNGPISDGYANVKGLLTHVKNGTVPTGVSAFHAGAFLDPLWHDKDIANRRFVKLETPYEVMPPSRWSMRLRAGKSSDGTLGHHEP